MDSGADACPGQWVDVKRHKSGPGLTNEWGPWMECFVARRGGLRRCERKNGDPAEGVIQV